MAITDKTTSTETTITWTQSGFSSGKARTFKFYITDANDNYIYDGSKSTSKNQTSVTYTYTGLSAGYDYRLKSQQEGLSVYRSVTASTKEKPIVITEDVTSTANSITYSLSGFSQNSDSRDFTFYLDGRAVGRVTMPAYGRYVSYTYADLKPETSYSLKAHMVTGSGFEKDYYNEGKTKAEVSTMYVSAYAQGTSISISIYGLNSSVYQRYVDIAVNGVSATRINIPAGDSSSKGYVYRGEEGKTYEVTARMYKSDGTFLTSDSDTESIPIDTSFLAKVNTITETSVDLYAYGFGSNKSYARYIEWWRKGGSDAQYVKIGTTQIPARYATTDAKLTASNLRANSHYDFRLDFYGNGRKLNSKTLSANTLEVAGNLIVNSIGETSAVLILKGLTNAIGRTIKWYHKKGTENNWTADGETAVAEFTTSVTKTVSGLINNTNYNFKAEIYDANDKKYVVGIKTATAETRKQLAVMNLDEASARSLRVKLTAIEPNVPFRRYYHWYIKRSTDAEWIASGTDMIMPNSADTSVVRIFSDLISSTIGADGTINKAEYDVKVVIKKDDTAIMGTLTGTYATTLHLDQVPSPYISAAEQLIGTDKIRIDWSCPDYIPSSVPYLNFKICLGDYYSHSISQSMTVNEPPAEGFTIMKPYTIDTVYDVWIEVRSIEDPSQTNGSNAILGVSLYSEFEWNQFVIQGSEFRLWASEWNAFTKWLIKALEVNSIANTFDFDVVAPTQTIKASTFNKAIDALSAIGECLVTKKKTGDAIRAADLIEMARLVNKGVKKK